jgi:hypothetical protein
MNVDGVFAKLIASQKTSRPTKINPKIEIKLGRLKRVARVGAEASAAKVQGDFTASSRKVLRRRHDGGNTRTRGTIPHGPKWRNWQTRRTQNPVPSGECGFDSHLRHSVLTGRCDANSRPVGRLEHPFRSRTSVSFAVHCSYGARSSDLDPPTRPVPRSLGRSRACLLRHLPDVRRGDRDGCCDDVRRLAPPRPRLTPSAGAPTGRRRP